MRRIASLAILFTLLTTMGSFGAETVRAIKAIGAENQYADVIAQVGGNFVQAHALLEDPNTDPHSFEINPRIAREIAEAGLIVVNGLGYDDWADKIIAASTRPNRLIINVQKLLSLPDDTANPHLWYDPKTMPAVAKAIAEALTKALPTQAAYFHANAQAFILSLQPWTSAIATFKAQHGGTPIAVTEPVADNMLHAMGFAILTPFSLEKSIMDGTDPSPQDITVQNGLLSGRTVKVLAYNAQVTSSLTRSYLDRAKTSGVPVVAVYETMPKPGYTYQSWMMAEVSALERAVSGQMSTMSLLAGP